MSKEDAYITTLRFGRIHLDVGVRFPELLEHLTKKGIPFEKTSIIDLFGELFLCKSRPRGNQKGIVPEDDEVYFLQQEGYFKLLEYEELSEARTSARSATRYAIFAIVISIIASGLSAYLSVKQMRSSVYVSEEQIQRLSSEELQIQGAEQLRLLKLINDKLEEINKHNQSAHTTPAIAPR